MVFSRVVDSVLELIGNTPMIRLNRIGKNLKSKILAKCEFLNPSGSYKDRIALKMIDEEEKRGGISPSKTVILESSSGNTAIALAMVGAVKGYKVKIYYPEPAWTPEKVKILQRFGAEIITISLEETEIQRKYGLHGARIEIPGRVKCSELEQIDPEHYWWAKQFSNPNNWRAHTDLGREILEQTNGEVDVFVASIGTGGCLYGVAKVLKEANPNCRVIAVQPGGWKGWIDPLSPDTKYIPGITGGIIEMIRNEGIFDDKVMVSTEEAREMAYRLSREEGLFVGISSGANVLVALREAIRLDKEGRNGNVVTVLVDRGDRYFTDETYIT
ncbi:MAG: PLP-dependent cysteine synthase family protein [Candidatus Methanomethylicia archaeon]